MLEKRRKISVKWPSGISLTKMVFTFTMIVCCSGKKSMKIMPKLLVKTTLEMTKIAFNFGFKWQKPIRTLARLAVQVNVWKNVT